MKGRVDSGRGRRERARSLAKMGGKLEEGLEAELLWEQKWKEWLLWV